MKFFIGCVLLLAGAVLGFVFYSVGDLWRRVFGKARQ